MTSKEKIWVGIGGFLLSNLSIVLTLYFAGHFSNPATATAAQPTSVTDIIPLDAEQQAALDAKNAAIAAKYLPPDFKPEASRLNYVSNLGQAMDICAAKLEESKPGVVKGYQFNHIASNFDETTDIFHVFMDMETISTATSSEHADITCDVDAPSRAVVTFKITDKSKKDEEEEPAPE